MMTIKASYGADIRRFTFDSEDVRLHVLSALIAQDFGLDAAGLVLKYEDDEGDLCLITSEEELREAIRLANGTLKVMVDAAPKTVADPKPVEAKPEAKHAEAKPAEAKHAEAKPVVAEPKPVVAEAKPVLAEAKPVVEAKPLAEAKPVVAEAKPVVAEAKPVVVAEPKPVVAEPTKPVVAEAKPVEAKAAEAEPVKPTTPVSKEGESVGWMDWLKRKAESKPKQQNSPNSVQFMSDVTLPDGSVHAPGAKMTKVWRVRNDGNAVWTARSYLVEKDGGELLELPALNPGQVTDLAIEVTLPDTEGNHRMEYFLVDATNLKFTNNNHLWTDIVIKKEEEEKADEPKPEPAVQPVSVPKPVVEAAKPVVEAAKPVVEAAKPVVQAAKPVVQAAKPVEVVKPALAKPVAVAKPIEQPKQPVQPTPQPQPSKPLVPALAVKVGPSKQELIASLRAFLSEAAVQEALKQASPVALAGIACNKPAALLIPEIVASQPALANHPFSKQTLLPIILPKIAKRLDAVAPLMKMLLCKMVGEVPVMAVLAPEELAKLFDDEVAEAKKEEKAVVVPARMETPSKETSIHRSVTCDHCGMTPIKGIRFKCTVCADYDLCESCEARDAHDNDHQMLKIRKPTQVARKEKEQRAARSWMPSWRAAEPVAPTLTPTPTSPVAQSIPAPCKLARQNSGGRWGGAKKKEKALSAKFVDDVTVRDGTIVAPGSTVVKTWRVQNDGTARWPEDLSLVNTSGKILLAPVAQPVVPVTEPGAMVDVSAHVKIPSDEVGRLNGYFRLSNKAGKKFGPRMWLDVTSDVQKPAEPAPQPAIIAPVVSAPVAAAVVPAPVAPVFEGEHAEKLQQLHTMGFVDQSLNRDLIVAADGDILKVITWLLTKKN